MLEVLGQSVVCCLEMDQHKKRRRTRILHIRRDRFLTLLGSVIIFVTFIAKEGIGESLKDLVSAMDLAESRFVLRQDIASTVRNRLPPTSPFVNS